MSYVMARKGILVSNPDVGRMSRVQWLFEYHSLINKERESMKLNIKVMKGLLINVLGLNALRPEDAQGNPKDYASLTPEEQESYLPLVAWCGRPELLQKISDQIQKEEIVADIGKDTSYETLVAQMDAADGDLLPIIQEKFGIKTEDLKQQTSVNQKEDLKKLGIRDISEMSLNVDSDEI